MRRGGWPGALQVGLLVAAVMLVWTAWVVGEVQVPESAGRALPQVVRLGSGRDCPDDARDPLF